MIDRLLTEKGSVPLLIALLGVSVSGKRDYRTYRLNLHCSKQAAELLVY